MKITCDWLKQFVDVSENEVELTEILYQLGFGIESHKNGTIDLEITPNRGDALSIYGLAREYGAYKGVKIKPYPIRRIGPVHDLSDYVRISTDKINSYYALIMDDVNVRESTGIIRDRLTIIDVNLVNNIVDITNYIMHETGIPLHAYDLDKITNVIEFRQTTNLEKLTVLNNREYNLPIHSLVGYDGDNVIDLVGIQGGINVDVDDNTKKILLHAPNIDPKLIRRTSQLLNLSTPASYRYERGIDGDMIEAAVLRAASLIEDQRSGRTIGAINKLTHPRENSLQLDWDKVNALLGTNIGQDKSSEILSNLGFKTINSKIIIPSWRRYDINYPEDLIEEIARIYGYNKLSTSPLPSQKYSENIDDKIYSLITDLSNRLLCLGFDEVMTYSFISSEFTDTNQINNLVEVKNPLSKLNQYLRDCLIPLLLAAAEQNIWATEINFFEIGTVFINGKEQIHAAIISTKKIKFIQTRRTNQYPNGVRTKRSYYVYEGQLKEVSQLVPTKQCFKQVKMPYRVSSKYPVAVRDISFIIDDTFKIEDVVSNLRNEEVLSINIIDIYKSDKFAKNRTSYCLRLLINNPNNKLTIEKIDKIVSEASILLKNKYAAIIR